MSNIFPPFCCSDKKTDANRETGNRKHRNSEVVQQEDHPRPTKTHLAAAEVAPMWDMAALVE